MKKRAVKRWLSAFLAAIMVFSGSAYNFPAVVYATAADYEPEETTVSEGGLIYVDDAAEDGVVYSDDVTEEDLLYEEAEEVPYAGAGDYGLCDNIQDGTILHCFDWKYSDIEAELPNIAAAGFTSVQTSPAQRDDGADRYIWYMLYQPQSFAVATNPLGTKEELASLCRKAETYGIKVIVDVVANHMRGDGYDVDSNMSRNSHQDYWHQNDLGKGTPIDWTNRWQVHQGRIGMEDLNSEHSEVQKIVAGYIEELKGIGVDGIRWDAAKHIGLPSESCGFWTAVTSQGLYHYGEILEGPDDRESGNESLMKEYTNYMSVTDNGYGNNLTGNFRDGKVITDNGKWTNKGINANKLVYWGESHDTYSNDTNEGGWTKYIDQNVIDRSYAIAASRKDATALYFSRPNATDKRQIMAGAKGSTHFTSKEVAEVNHFHNAVVGEREYYVGDTNNNVAAVCRESGAVVVLGSGSNRDVTVSNGGGTVKPGTYTDQISGSTWTVTSSTMSGRVGDKGIAVFYDAKPVVKTPQPTISKEGGSFNDTLTLTIGLTNATSGTYKIGNRAAQTYTSSTQITIGSDMAFGDSVTIVLTATDGSKTETKSYTFTKVDKVVNKAYLSLPSGWSEPVYCYAYDSATEKINNGTWPGVAMTKDSSTGYYVYEIPENIERPRVIFYSSDTNRSPADNEKGYQFEEDGSYLYKDGSWAKYTPPVTEGKVIVKYVDDKGNSIASQQTLKGKIGESYTTTAASISGYKLKQTPSNASGKYTSADITVTYVYEEVISNVLDVTSSLVDGTTFETETATITLTAKNATSATYTVDDGPVKTFTGSAQVVIGQGKIADTEVKVKVTATNGTDTVNKTFTYKKKFSGKVANETTGSLPRAALKQSEEAVRSGASSKLASQYSTNGKGYGKEATITIDGSISDWNESMLIAQGAAWDVPNHWKGTHENCVIDTYSLYAAYDNDNLYIGVQMVNVGDTIYYEGCGALLDGGVPGDVPLIIAIDTGKGNKMTGKLADGKYIWGAQVDFNKMADNLLYMSCKPGLGQPSIFKAGSNGLTDYTDEKLCISFKDAGISYKVAHECLPSELIGLDHNGGKIEDILNSSGPWVNYKTFTANQGSTHSSKYDSFFEVAIPYTALGITKSDLMQNGVGVLAVGTRGESGLDCIPYDYDAMTDNIMGDYSADSSTSGEKDDVDVLTVNYARVGSSSSPNPNPNPNPDPDPDPATDLTVNFGADRSSPQLSTTDLTLKAIASGGKSAYTYEFFVDGASVQGKSSRDTYTWRPSAGSHTIKVTVTDSNGKTVSSQKAYAIEENGDQPVDPTQISFSFANPNARYVYDGTAKRADVIVRDGTKTLVKDRDYSLWYYNYINAGDKDSQNPPTVIVVGKGDYASKITNHIMTYTIEKAGIPDGAPEGEMKANAGPVSALTLNAGWEWSEADKNTVLQTGTTISVSAVYNGADKENYMITTVAVRLTGISCDHTGTEKETIVTIAPTCTQTGRSDVICKECHTKVSDGETVPALGHIGGTATCSSQATCGRCKQKYGDFNNENHANIVVHNKKEANCQQAGYTGDAVCEDCNSLIASGKPVAKTDHRWDGGKVTKAPTATADGVRTYTCTVCKTATRTETIPKTGGGSSSVPGQSLQVGDPVMDTASKGIYKVTKADSAVKTVEFVLPSSTAKTVTIPDSISVKGTTYQVTSIADSAFKNNKTVQSVKMGSNIKTIGTGAFSGCSKLKKVTLASGTAAIGSKAFYKCTKLTSITIPSKVNKIGSKAFYGCKKLKKITIKTTKLTKNKVGSQAFKGIAAKATIKVPKKKLSAYKKILRARGVGSKAKITK